MIEIDTNERILRVVRKHWFVLLGNLFLIVACLFVPVVLLFALHLLPFSVTSIVTWSGTPLFGQGFFLFTWLFIVWMIGWTLWTNYYLDVVIVTDKRIFTIEQDGLFHRSSSSFRTDRIQNTTVDQKGVIQTLLNFGTIRLETAGESEDFVGTFIADPYDLKKFINEMQDAALEKSQLVHTDGNTPVQDVVPITANGSGRLKESNEEGL